MKELITQIEKEFDEKWLDAYAFQDPNKEAVSPSKIKAFYREKLYAAEQKGREEAVKYISNNDTAGWFSSLEAHDAYMLLLEAAKQPN